MEDGTPPHNDQSQMLNFEIHSGQKNVNLENHLLVFYIQLKIHIGVYGGFGIDGYYGKKKLLDPAVACGYAINSGHEIKAGNPLEFYIGIDLFADLKIMLDWVWYLSISNADMDTEIQDQKPC